MQAGTLYGGAIVATISVVLAIAAGHEATMNMLPPNMKSMAFMMRKSQLENVSTVARPPFGMVGNFGKQTAQTRADESVPAATGTVG